jgi:hypothetical protein
MVSRRLRPPLNRKSRAKKFEEKCLCFLFRFRKMIGRAMQHSPVPKSMNFFRNRTKRTSEVDPDRRHATNHRSCRYRMNEFRHTKKVMSEGKGTTGREEDEGPAAELLVEADDEVLLVGGEVAPLDVRAEVVDPAQAAALAAPEQAGLLGQRAPVGVAVLPDVGHKPLVLLGAPRAPAQALLLAARRPPHRSCLALPGPGREGARGTRFFLAFGRTAVSLRE